MSDTGEQVSRWTDRFQSPNFIMMVGAGLLILGTVAFLISPRETAMTVYRSPGCGCCEVWVAYMEENGFAIQMSDAPEPTDTAVPDHLASCHTAYVDSYIIEGHIPAEDVRRLLREQPKVAGLVVPGMPEGSPGMEGPHPVAYDVYTFNHNGEVQVFASHSP